LPLIGLEVRVSLEHQHGWLWQLFKNLILDHQIVWLMDVHIQSEFMRAAVCSWQEGGSAVADNLSIHQDSDIVTDLLSLFDVISSQENSSILLDLFDSSGESTSGAGIHTSERLVKILNLWLDDGAHSEGELTLVILGQLASHNIPVTCHFQYLKKQSAIVQDLRFRKTLDLGHELQVLLHSHLLDNQVILWTQA
jgi:hypothetical protein